MRKSYIKVKATYGSDNQYGISAILTMGKEFYWKWMDDKGESKYTKAEGQMETFCKDNKKGMPTVVYIYQIAVSAFYKPSSTEDYAYEISKLCGIKEIQVDYVSMCMTEEEENDCLFLKKDPLSCTEVKTTNIVNLRLEDRKKKPKPKEQEAEME